MWKKNKRGRRVNRRGERRISRGGERGRRGIRRGIKGRRRGRSGERRIRREGGRGRRGIRRGIKGRRRGRSGERRIRREGGRGRRGIRRGIRGRRERRVKRRGERRRGRRRRRRTAFSRKFLSQTDTLVSETVVQTEFPVSCTCQCEVWLSITRHPWLYGLLTWHSLVQVAPGKKKVEVFSRHIKDGGSQTLTVRGATGPKQTAGTRVYVRTA